MAHQAQDTFVATLDDGSEQLITKGQLLADRHELVVRDQKGSKTLFRPLDIDGDDAPAKSDAKADPKAEVKTSPTRGSAR